MRCERCNTLLPENSRVCPFCKTAVSLEPPPAPPLSAQKEQERVCLLDQQANARTDDEKRQSRGAKPLTFLCIVLVLGVLALGVLCIVQEGRYSRLMAQQEEQLVKQKEQLATLQTLVESQSQRIDELTAELAKR